MTKSLAEARRPIQSCKSPSPSDVLPVRSSCTPAASAARCFGTVLNPARCDSHPTTEVISSQDSTTYRVFPPDSQCGELHHRCDPARDVGRSHCGNHCATSPRTADDNQCGGGANSANSAGNRKDACSARDSSCRNRNMGGTSGSRRTKRLFGGWSSRTGPWLLFGAVVLFAMTVDAQSLKAQNVSPKKKSEICPSVDIRNSQETFEKLRGCRVVEGFVQILLFDKTEELASANISFPELTEITDYLLLFRVNGLKTLGDLFPNLAVIRGQKTFFNYAFVLFEMSHLQEIGLYSLTDIVHGLVRIDKNPFLCYVNTIDWDLIAKEGKGDEHFIKSNKLENECPVCPGDDGSDPKCPTARNRDLSSGARHLCWNRNKCQKVCPDRCIKEGKTCNDNECCHESCLGGCSGPRLDVCTVCKKLTVGEGYQRQCTTKCPADFYKFLNRRCVTLNECINMSRPVEEMEHEYKDKPYKIFNDSCLLDCPTNYVEGTAIGENNNKYAICKPCEGSCKKECPGTNVDSISTAQSLRGCTHIKGSLEIQIRGGRFAVKELEENLNMIEVIDGYLKIARSFPLISLNFLKNLREIRGIQMESGKFILIVLDNQNLQELWDFDKNRTIKINPEGRFFFHFNPKLCLNKIERLRQIANLKEFSDVDVASSSNGDKVACNVTELHVNITKIFGEAVILTWKQFKMDDQRSLLGYVVHSIEAPTKNITLYDGRDGCGGDGWRVDDVSPEDDKSDQIFHIITQLKPYTQYAFYVRTYTIASEISGAQSQILYFKTRPDIPSKPMKLNVISTDSNKFEIKWEPPNEPNGNVTYYNLNITCSPISPNDRDYCKEPPTQIPEEKPPVKLDPVPDPNNETCSCDSSEVKNINNKNNKERERVSQINFEDELHNKVYIKRTDSGNRKKREINRPRKMYAPQKNIGSAPVPSYESPAPRSGQTIEKEITGNCKSRNYVVMQTNFSLDDLPHFTTYTIHVQACREREVDDTGQVCSTASIFTARTLKAEKVDDVTHVRVAVPANQTFDTVRLMWDEPENPNGIILTYQIQYRRVDNVNYKPMVECVTRREYLEKKQYILKQLAPGNYSVRVMATSLAGDGGFSPENNFVIEDARSGHAIEVIIGVVSTLLIMCLGVCGYIVIRRRFAPTVPNMKLIASVNPEYVSTAYVPDDWEIPRKKIELLRELGQGSFGMVYEGIARDVVKGKSEIRCAIKTVNEHATDRERIEFLNEASVMKAFDTTHVVRLLGVVSQGQPTLVVMELMANGDLKSYLRSHRPDAETYNPSLNRQPPTLKRILQMAIEIADGMAYLAAKKFVHRDLAARNCMVAEDLTVKIGDFGMTRDIYETDYYRKGTKGLLPVRWMAPESLKDGVFTSNSDVWSYGVVLWEMATLASQPYQGLSNDQVLRYVIDGGIMERPENCPDKLYNLMRVCWQHKPSLRPSFLKLATILLDDASSTFKQVSFYHSTAGIEARTIHNAAQDDPSTPLRLTKEIEDFSLGSGSEPDSEPEDLVDDGANSDFEDKHVTINFPGFQVASFKGNQKSLDTSGPSLYSYKDHDRSQDTSGPSFGSYSEQSRMHEPRSLFNARDRKRSTESMHSGGGRDSLLKESEDSASAEANTTANGYVGGRPTSSAVKTTR